MTILGGIVRPDRAILWADSEIYRDEQPSGVGAKMCINPLGLATIGSGSMDLIRTAAAVSQTCSSIDEAELRLPAALRSKAAQLAPALVRSDADWCNSQTIVAVGFSPSAGRAIGWRFCGSGFFEPILVSVFSQPRETDLEVNIRQIQSFRDIVRVARRQITLLRRVIPEATGETLTVLEVTQQGLHCQKIAGFCPPLINLHSVAAGSSVAERLVL